MVTATNGDNDNGNGDSGDGDNDNGGGSGSTTTAATMMVIAAMTTMTTMVVAAMAAMTTVATTMVTVANSTRRRRIFIPTSTFTGYIPRVFLPYAEKSISKNLAVTSLHISCLLSPGLCCRGVARTLASSHYRTPCQKNMIANLGPRPPPSDR